MPSSTPITVRDATLADLDHIVEYNCRLAEESEDKRLDREILTEGVRRGLEQPTLCRYFVAECEGHPVGTTMVTYELTDWRCGVLWWFQSVYVEPEFRRYGVFREIYRHIESLAQGDANVRGLRLYVRHDNDRARKTYEAMGMSTAGYDVYEIDWSAADRDV